MTVQYSDFTIAMRDYRDAIVNNDEEKIQEAYTRETFDGEYSSLKNWAENVGPADEMEFMWKRDLTQINYYLAAWEKDDEENNA